MRVFDTSGQSSVGDVVVSGRDETIVVSETGGLAYTGPGAASAIKSPYSGSLIINGELYGYNGILISGAFNAVTVGATGFIYGDAFGISGLTNDNLVNSGTIHGTIAGVSFGASSSVVNNGTISAEQFGLQLTGTVKIVNSGAISGLWGVYTDVAEKITLSNSGTISSSAPASGIAVQLAGGHDSLTNIGAILGAVDMSGGADWFHNTGSVAGSVAMGSEDDVLLNSGLITGNASTGITLDAGNDLFDGEGGRVRGAIDGGIGNDTLTGGDFAERFNANASDGRDEIYGGLGRDTYDASAEGTVGLRIDLLNGTAWFPGKGNRDLVLDIERVIGTAAADTIRGANGIETLSGGDGNDSVYGRGGNDLLYGGSGNDILDGSDGTDLLTGGAGDDVFYGGAGTDILTSDEGRDTLTGGADADVFIFESLQRAAGPTGYIADLITDFQKFSDLINLTAIDSNSVLGGNQTFIWMGTAGPSAVGQAGYTTSGGVTSIWAYTDASMPLAAYTILQLTGTFSLISSDFQL